MRRKAGDCWNITGIRGEKICNHNLVKVFIQYLNIEGTIDFINSN